MWPASAHLLFWSFAINTVAIPKPVKNKTLGWDKNCGAIEGFPSQNEFGQKYQKKVVGSSIIKKEVFVK